MKTKMRNIAMAVALTVGVTSVTASQFNDAEWVLNTAERTMEMEGRMPDASLFGTDDSKTANSTVVEIAVGNPDFSILVEAVTKAGLAEALSADGPFTVFAPTNDAFKSLFSKLGVSGVKDLTAEQLTPILTYHVVSGKVMSTDLSNTSAATLNGQKIKIDLSSGVKINDSKVVAADIEGKNGVIHVIDSVLLPE
ncbi:fasciclin domain-containing protein [Mariniphaga sediminis]|uniref:Fasciclin domain-containing protein n=1 Tax=Mariniphaga sediminis TaxID=1628158 RepID=A0A399CUK2_9BACT|nr:fasciclin domain-containing protein [Mariniphaga sediminis]RIH63339.1 fasciclin domain-containing protein [Mariniphaga sediminis]